MFRRIGTFVSLAAALTVVGVAHAKPAPDGIADLSRRIAKLTSTRVDPALVMAAKRHATEIVRDTQRATRGRLERAVQSEGLADALLVPFSAVGDDATALTAALTSFAQTTARTQGPTHVGLATAQSGDRTALVAIFSRRLVALAPLPGKVQRGPLTVRGRAQKPARLSALLLGPCVENRCPSAVQTIPIQTRKDVVRIELPVASTGWYVLDILYDGPRGPETAAYWLFSVGSKPGPRPSAAEGVTSLADAVANSRDAAQLGPLGPDEALQTAAQRHADAVCKAGIAAHVLGKGDNPNARAKRAGFVGRVTENVAIAPTLAEAHHNFMWSPSHRQNILDPTASVVGIGTARRKARPGVLPGVCVVELFGQPGR